MDDKASFNQVFRERTKAALLRVIRVFQQLPRTGEAQVWGEQLLRSATSVAANYRAACRDRVVCQNVRLPGRSRRNPILAGAIRRCRDFPKAKLASLEQEYGEIVAILTTARKSYRSKKVNE